MAWFDLPLDQLEVYRPELAEPPDLDEFWQRTLTDARTKATAAQVDPYDCPLKTVQAYDVTFSGFAGDPIKAWLLLPRDHGPDPLACVVEFLGYGTGRGEVHERLLYSACGYAHLVMDTRGQGSMGSAGATADRDPDPGDGQYPGFLTRGVLDPERYYYRRLITDAVRAVDTARTIPFIDPDRVATLGHSQGGALAIAAAALHPDVAAVVAHAPFLAHISRGITITDSGPYAELREFLRHRRDRIDDVLRTVSYVDSAVLAARATAPLHASVALMDDVCPPSTVFAAYNNYAGMGKEMVVWPYNGHESGAAQGRDRELAFLARTLR